MKGNEFDGQRNFRVKGKRRIWSETEIIEKKKSEKIVIRGAKEIGSN